MEDLPDVEDVEDLAVLDDEAPENLLVMKKDVSADSVEDMDVDEPILPVVVEDLLEDLAFLDLRVDDEAPEDLQVMKKDVSAEKSVQ